MRPGAIALSRGRIRAALAAAFAAAALAPALALRGFTVDDALITARYAAHIAGGQGYRLSAGGPVTDGVTPLGFAFVLAPFAGRGPLAALAAAKVLGVVAWTLAAAVVGLAAARVVETPGGAGAPEQPAGAVRAGRALVLVPLALVATSAPLGAWAAAGMETGLVTALAALAAALPILGRPRLAVVCAGVCAGLRPELLPWAATLGVGLFLILRGAGRPDGTDTPAANGARVRRPWLLVVPVVLPFVAAAVVRLVVFGRPAPLSVFAKAPDARLGLLYAAACALLAGPPALFAPLVLARGLGSGGTRAPEDGAPSGRTAPGAPLPGWARVLATGVLVHLAAVALAGGDWMPLSRLVVPVLPSLALAALFVARHAALAATAARLAAAVAGQVFVLVHVGPAAARVGEDRLRVIEELGPALAPARVVASLDIGWVGAATSAALVDLAGVTDPAIAALPGGHTTKQIPAGLLSARGADTLVLLLAPGERAAEPWTRSRFARGVEMWVATTPGIGDDFAIVAEGSAPTLRYLVLRKSR